MKITSIETVRLGEFANIIWVRIHTDEGLIGLGETFMGAAAVEAYIHETVAPKLIGGEHAPSAVAGAGKATMAEAWPLAEMYWRACGDDLAIGAFVP